MKIEVMQNILGANETTAAANKSLFAAESVAVVNLMGSPGAGKTSVLEKTLVKLKDELRLAVIEGDLFTAKDGERIETLGIPVIQINTAGGCHLDAGMVQKALASLKVAELDLIIIENVGNLVCPAEFNLGEDCKATVLSVTEGDDKPLKYPLIFKESSAVLINKVDILPYTNFNLATAKEDMSALNPGLKIIETSCTTEQGIDEWCAWLKNLAAQKRMVGGKKS